MAYAFLRKQSTISLLALVPTSAPDCLPCKSRVKQKGKRLKYAYLLLSSRRMISKFEFVFLVRWSDLDDFSSLCDGGAIKFMKVERTENDFRFIAIVGTTFCLCTMALVVQALHRVYNLYISNVSESTSQPIPQVP